MPFDLAGIAYTASIWALPVLFAITLHEAAHGWAAWRLGDDTAKVLGRVSFNPLRHVDPFGTVLLPVLLLLIRAPFLFGWAKPVPVNFHRLRKPRSGMVLVAAAGPAANIAIAYLSALALHLVPYAPVMAGDWLARNLVNSVTLNLVLAVFNMLPIPPLDGGRVAVGLLPASLAVPLARLERYGMLIIIGILFILPTLGGSFGVNIDVFRQLVIGPVNFLTGVIAAAAGVQ